jgi:arabinogalactan oligomer/maltooligosaccharide transport system permease protein
LIVRWLVILAAVLALARGASAADVVVWHAWMGAEEAGLVAAAQRFEAGGGGRVSLVAVPFGVFDAKIETAIPRGNGPDVVIAGHGGLGKWARMGLFDPVDDLVIAPQMPVAEEAMRWEGARYGVPLAYKTLVLLYDPAQVAAPPKTTDELVALARSLAGEGRYGLAYEAGAAFYHAPFMHGFGAAMWQDGALSRLDTPAHAGALGLSARLAALGPTRPSSERIGQLYREGKAAMVISGPWFVADLGRPIAAAPLPIVSETGQPARPYLTVDGAYVTRGPNTDAARAFVSFLAGEASAIVRRDVGGQAVTTLGVSADDPVRTALAAQAAVAVPMPSDPKALMAWEPLNKALRQTQRGAASPEGAAAEAQAWLELLTRPPPEPASPTPYLMLVGVLGLLAVGRVAQRLSSVELRGQIAAHRADYLWVAPAALAVLVLVVAPFLVGATVSLFAHYEGSWTFVGLRHFADIVLSRDWPITSPMSFPFTLAVTVLWTITNVFLHVTIGVALALVLREPWVRLRAVWRVLLIVPWAVPSYITALIWRTMFDAQYGAINAVLSLVLGHPVELDWFARFSTAFAANLVTNTWLGFPFMMVIALGAMQSIPRELEEAALIDGAGYFTRLRHVLWPLLRPAMLPAVVLGSVWTFNMFNVIYLVSGGEPDGATEILISEAWRWAFSRGNRYGYAAAYAVVIFGVLFVYSRFTNRLLGKRVL